MGENVKSGSLSNRMGRWGLDWYGLG